VQRDRWTLIERLYFSAPQTDEPRVFVAEQCHGDADLEREVLLLLKEEPLTVTLFGRMLASSTFDGVTRPHRELLEPDSRFGPYVVRAHLGSGGTSDVYQAFDPRLDRYVALKVFAETALTKALKPRFVLEARAAAGVNHHNIATIYEVGEVGPSCYLTMAFVDGVRLRDKLRDQSCTEYQRLAYLIQVGHALERAHEQGIIHCDLKPENIMIARDGLVKILEFGLARLMKDYRAEPVVLAAGVASGSADAPTPWHEHTVEIEGTVGYMSPEQASGRALDERSDVFSWLHVVRGGHRHAAVLARVGRDGPSSTASRTAAASCVHRRRAVRRASGADRQMPGEGTRSAMALDRRGQRATPRASRGAGSSGLEAPALDLGGGRCRDRGRRRRGVAVAFDFAARGVGRGDSVRAR
jgi:tRNA A-37 threonylcarbamoyl transferase component Bud32